MSRIFGNSGIWILLGIMVIYNFVDGGLSDPKAWLLNTLEMIPGIVIGLSFHEFGHAVTSYKLGDMTPKFQGRVTLNPMAHIDPIGMICLFFAGFGWGVPVEINPNAYKHPRRDEFFVSVAGVVMNLLLAVASAVILRFLVYSPWVQTDIGGIVFDIVVQMMMINLVLMIFNLLPIPPLDGFGIITQIFNLRGTAFYNAVYDKGFIILMILILFNVTSLILTPAVTGISDLLINTIIYH